ncbi:WYL domain-containing protein [Leptospira ognonensis]|uniref:WYL domain-containing protein n=1 Tax=Leptospira ognonensis TaxID=2484945 RepID=A0A4R9JWC8_9LEPT|nr:WYL domain-containing protein [Leptospira ognonensis]TGL56334.1 WYL domain-containing protein [Leptospira ognonensis]
MNPSTLRAASKLNLIRILSSHPDGLSLEELQKITGHKSITELRNELGELYMIEMYPYSPQDCVDIDFDGDRVKISLPVAVDKVLPLSPEEWILLRDLLLKRNSTELNSSEPLAKQLLEKIDSVIPSGKWEPNKKIRDDIESAIQKKIQIKIQYWKRDKDLKEERFVQPWLLWESNDGYLLAYDLEKKGFRSFRLDCILKVSLTTEKNIELPDDAKTWLDGFSQMVLPKKTEHEAIAEVYLTDSSSFHLGQKLPLTNLNLSETLCGVEYYLFQVPIREENWFINTILGYGKSAIIKNPIAIRDKIKMQIGEAMSTLA